MVEDYFEAFRMMDKTSHPDPFSGVSYTWTEGAMFKAGCVMNSSNTAQVAYQQGAKVIFTIVIPADTDLAIGDRIKRVNGGTIMKVTSNPQDMRPPSVASAAMNYKQCTAEVIE